MNCTAIWASTSQGHTISLHTNKLSLTAYWKWELVHYYMSITRALQKYTVVVPLPWMMINIILHRGIYVVFHDISKNSIACSTNRLGYTLVSQYFCSSIRDTNPMFCVVKHNRLENISNILHEINLTWKLAGCGRSHL